MLRRLVVLGALLLGFVVAPPAGAMPFPASVPLPADFQPEGIDVGAGSMFYVGSLRSGDIYRGDLRTGQGAVFVHAPAGRQAVGLKVDQAHHLIFVAGGGTGDAFVYDARTGAPVATYDFGGSFLNDVVVTPDAAFFTETFGPVLYKIPISPSGALGTGSTLHLSGPAATTVPNDFNLNGIQATPDGSTLIVGNSSLGRLFTVDPMTGASAGIAVDGIIPGTPDGLLLAGPDLWVVENSANTVVRVRLAPDLSSGTITRTVTGSQFRVPTTIAKFGDRLAAVNGRFDLGFPPPFGPGAPPGTTFDVAVFRANG
jgi:sugar lactone lactonase YvrE